MIKELLLTGLLVFADVNLGFTSANLYAAELVWSSSSYDYMILNGQKYLPINTEGNSVFSIPVMCFDKEMTVTADTTAMSTPHEVEYTLMFTQGSAKVLESKGADSGMDWNLVFLILIAVITGATVAIYGTNKKK